LTWIINVREKMKEKKSGWLISAHSFVLAREIDVQILASYVPALDGISLCHDAAGDQANARWDLGSG
jgi:hypothetical protein